MSSVHLHLRVVVEPDVTITTLIDSCEKVFGQAKISIKIDSDVTLKLSKADLVKFTALRVRKECAGTALTSEQENLFALAASIDKRDVVVFFVQDTDKALEGCAQHPPGRPGAVVTSICAQWTLAHELGHLLGLGHVDQNSRIMFNGGTLGITANPPKLTPEEINVILQNKSKLLR